LLDRLLDPLKDAGNADRIVGAALFTGLAAGALFLMEHQYITALHPHNDLITCGMPPGSHLCISKLVDRACRTAVPAPHAQVRVNGDAEGE
jgi:hypothetical protein